MPAYHTGAGNTNLDAVFNAGNTSQDTGFVDSGVILGNRYAPLSLGAMASAVGYLYSVSGVNINQYYAGYNTVAHGPMWPVGQGYQVGVNGILMSAGGTAVLTGRQAWQFQNINNVVDNAAFTTNNIADFFAPCPSGAGVGNTSVYTPLGGFATGGNYGLPAGAVLRFATNTDNLAGTLNLDITVGAATEGYHFWTALHSGGLAFCGNAFPYYENIHNVLGFLPGAGTYYGMCTAYVYWARPNYWAVRLASAFCCNQGDGSLNVIRTAVTRIA